jgi:CHU_C Type IX secretion signal domain
LSQFGQLLFLTKDKNAGWNGMYKNQRQQMGAYTWVITYQTFQERITKSINGIVMLLQ